VVESGEIEITIKKYDRSEHIAFISPGACFGEMAIMGDSTRTATARATRQTSVLCVDKRDFMRLVKANRHIGEKFHKLLSKRNEELALKESVLDSTAFESNHLHVSIKGDPSMRESVFNRERYQSLVDELLPDLIANMQTMLLERNVFRIFLNFNSGEVRVYTVFDPFTPETHAANKVVSKTYLDRHFPPISYAAKNKIIEKIYKLLLDEPYFQNLSKHWQHLFIDQLRAWQPVSRAKIKTALAQLPILRDLENYYLRNFSINTVQDVMRMQFNCDGTHIVNSEDYLRFLEENI
jgi:hypothetical protein